MKIHYTRCILTVLLSCLALHGLADVRLPQLISSGMVLQRDAEVTIWGWADPAEDLAVTFGGRTYRTTADGSGQWFVTLPKMKAGGPYRMNIEGNNTVVLEDILIGDVWVASGQSNMELTMARAEPLYESEISGANNRNVRQFEVPDRYNFKAPQKDLEAGSWQPATTENIRQFSAVAYFFAEYLNDTQGVPIGILNASLGGSPVEAWISEETLKRFPQPYAEAQRFKDDSLIERIEARNRETNESWHDLLNKEDLGFKNGHYVWAEPALKTADWQTMDIPGYLPNADKGPVSGAVWFRKTVNIPAELAGKEARLLMGRIVDADSVFINGTLVGSTTYQYPPRRYHVPAGILQEGPNLIAVRVISHQGQGGFVPDKPYELQFEDHNIALTGEWRYRRGATMKPLASPTFVRWKPVGLYNAMIAPLLHYRIKGVIWYQGESNVRNADEYHARFSAMIADWRNRWDQGDFPFLFVQLANFLEPSAEPTDSDWALLREAQFETLSTPQTGMAVAIDVGEWNDIHPLDKKTVGERLGAAAQKIAYGKKIVHSGPLYKSAKVKGDKIVLTFSHVGSGLVAKGDDKLRQFAIAGPDRRFVWANAEIRQGKVVVWSDQIKTPVAVRYAWADNPEGANLYNREGFPASPFRTDNW